MRSIGFAAILGAGFLTSLALAQDDQTTGRKRQRAGESQTGQTKEFDLGGQVDHGDRPGFRNQGQRAGRIGERGQHSADSQLAAWLAIGNQGEVEMGKFAQEKASNDQVKQFAQKMVQDHTAMLGKLRQHMGTYTSAFGPEGAHGAARTEGADREGRSEGRNIGTTAGAAGARTSDEAIRGDVDRRQAQPRVSATTGATAQPGIEHSGPAGAGGRGFFDPIKFKHEVCHQCLQMAKNDLQQKQGKEFDMAYMGHMVMSHSEMIATLKTAATMLLRSLLS